MTAGNASPLNDGASAVLIGERGAATAGREPIARIAGRGTFARRPRHLRHRPRRGREQGARARRASPGATSTRSSSTRRSPRSRSRAWASGRSSTRRASTSTAARSRSATRSARPAGASSGTLAYTLKANGGSYGVAAICIGVGQGLAVVLEACDGFRDDSRRAIRRSTTRATSRPRLRHPKQPLIAAPAAADRDHRRRCSATSRARRARPRPHAPARGRADRPADHRPRPRQGGRRPAGAGHAGRDLAGQRRRPLPPPLGQLAVPDRPELHRRRAAASPTTTGYFRFVTIRPGAYPWGNHANAWRPAHIHFSLFGRAFTQRLVTQMYFPDDPLFFQDPMYNSVADRDPRAARADDQRLRLRVDRGAVGARVPLGHRAARRGGDADRGAARVTTPSQTVGPYLSIGLPWPDGPDVVPEGHAGPDPPLRQGLRRRGRRRSPTR